MRVGRAALDEDAIRLLEEHNPEVDFDWTQILKGKETPESRPQGGHAGAPPQARHQRPPREVRSDVQPGRPAQPIEPEPVEPVVVDAIAEDEIPEDLDAALAGGEPVAAAGVDDMEEGGAPLTPAAARLGAEGLLRLRARYAEVLARISQRVSDPVRQEELKAQAERLNPDAWVTNTEVVAGLEEYEATFDALQAVVGRKRKRRRRHRSGEAQPAGTGEVPGAGEPGGASDPEGADEPADTEENDGGHE